jgi:hypothetical protein
MPRELRDAQMQGSRPSYGEDRPHSVKHGEALCTVKNRCVIFLVSVNGAEFPMRNQRPNSNSPTTVNCTVRKYLTAREIEKLMDHARKHSRYGHRDATMVLVMASISSLSVCDSQPQA